MTPAERAKIVMLEARSGPLLDCHPDRTERLIAAAIEERQAEVDRLTAENAELRIGEAFHKVVLAERNLAWHHEKQLRELAGELSSELSEWRKTPFFQDEDEWVEWRNGLGRRVDASLAKAKALGIGGEG